MNRLQGFSRMQSAASRNQENVVPTTRHALGDIGNRVAPQQAYQGKTVRATAKTALAQVAHGFTRVKRATRSGVAPPPKRSIKQEAPKESESNDVMMDRPNVADVFKAKADDNLWASEYGMDILHYMLKKEPKCALPSNYMNGAPATLAVKPHMRSILVDWLVEVQVNFKLIPQVLRTTVAILDNYLSREAPEKSQVQLIGATCMFIASKVEEIYPPELADFVYICDDAYETDEFLNAERRILQVIGFKLERPSALFYKDLFITAATWGNNRLSQRGVIERLGHLVSYLIELSYMYPEFLHQLPSRVAAAAVTVAVEIMNRSPLPWTPTLEAYARCTKEQVQPLLDLYCRVIKGTPGKQRQIYDKYLAPSLGEASRRAEQYVKAYPAMGMPPQHTFF